MTHVSRSVLVALVLALFPAVARAQVVFTFDELATGLRPGTKLLVFDHSGKETDGRLQQINGAAVTLDVDGTQRRIDRAEVTLIRTLAHDPVWNGAWIGAAIGGGLGILATQATCGGDSCRGYSPTPEIVGAAVWGAGIGALVDACHLTPRDIYRAGSSEARRREIGFAPIRTQTATHAPTQPSPRSTGARGMVARISW